VKEQRERVMEDRRGKGCDGAEEKGLRVVAQLAKLNERVAAGRGPVGIYVCVSFSRGHVCNSAKS
jgi:hypothetical protein